ncbi:MAG: menaquinone biosynthesis decarboxylase [Cellulosilyticaceae bacterium]
MSYKNLQSFITALEKKGELKRVQKQVDSHLEITEITDRVSKKYGPALLFENVKGSAYPVLMNAMGTYERMSMALGVKHFEDLEKDLEKFLDMTNYMGLMNIAKSAPRLSRLAAVFPIKLPGKGSCQEVIEMEPDLSTLPVLHCWPEDGGPFFTLPLVMTKDPKTGIQNMGMYRLQVFDKNTTGMHWHWHKDGREIYESYKKLDGKMPVSVVLGCDPAITYAATAPLPKMIDEMMFAGYLRKMPVKMVKSITNDIYVPAEAEFVIEGYVDVNEALRHEGPFGDHTGYYSLADDYPAFHVTCITHKKKPVYPATIVGQPPMEDCYIGKATERLFLPLLRMISPEIVDIDFPLEGVFHGCVIVSIKKRYPGHAKKVMNTVWGMGQMMYTKMVIVVDEAVKPSDYASVAACVLENVWPMEDMIFSQGPLDALDHASPSAHYGCRLGLDATTPLPMEKGREQWHKAASTAQEATLEGEMIREVKLMKEGIFKGYTLVSIHKETAEEAKKVRELFFADEAATSHVCIIVDEHVDLDQASVVSWKLFNNIDAKRDIHIKEMGAGKVKVVIDATKKTTADGHFREWPEDIVMSEEVKVHVTKHWEEYGID